jgi:hypothetical protein
VEEVRIDLDVKILPLDEVAVVQSIVLVVVVVVVVVVDEESINLLGGEIGSENWSIRNGHPNDEQYDEMAEGDNM